jgi:hypothetical protein
VRGNVSHKRYADFPEGDPRERALPMDYTLTHEKLRGFEFDLNAEVLWGMEVPSRGAPSRSE